MADEEPLMKRSICTDIAGLCLSALSGDDSAIFYSLVDRNRKHLTRHGDYEDLGGATAASIARSLTDPVDKNLKFGIWLNKQLIGRVDLSPRDDGVYVIGYWLGDEFIGHGYATHACRALINDAILHLSATAFYAGVTKGNTKSEALLARLGFARTEDRGTYTLFRFAATTSDE